MSPAACAAVIRLHTQMVRVGPLPPERAAPARSGPYWLRLTRGCENDYNIGRQQFFYAADVAFAHKGLFCHFGKLRVSAEGLIRKLDELRRNSAADSKAAEGGRS